MVSNNNEKQFDKQITIPVQGMHCASCASVIKRRLEHMEGIASCRVNYATEKAHITFNPQKASIANMNLEINKFGYSLVDTPEVGVSHDLHNGHDMGNPISADSSVKMAKAQELEQLKHHVYISLPMAAVSVLMMIWEIGAMPFGLWPAMPDHVYEVFHHLLPLFATYTLFVIGLPYLQGMSRFFRYRVANMDSLVGIGTSIAFLYSFIVTAFEGPLSPYLNTHQNYYDVTIVVIGFITLGKFLEARSKLKTGEAIEKLLGLQAKEATILRDGEEIAVPVDQVVVGDILIIKPGANIPLDGVIEEGKSSIDESMITGEPLPVDKGPNAAVIGGTINKQGSLRIRVTFVGDETMLSQIIKMVADAQSSKAPIERIADQVSAVFVPIVLILAGITLILWLAIGSQFMPFSQAVTLGLLSFVGILVIACPCAMGLATPTAIIVGIGKAAQHGILIKNAESLEKFNSITLVVMDKTGTLTKGMPELIDIKPLKKQSQQHVLQLLASLEHHSEHPLAQAVVQAAKQKAITLQTVKDFEIIEGKGVKGNIATMQYFAGNQALAHDLKLSIDKDIIDTFASQGKTPVILMSKKEILAYVSIADTVKSDALETVSALHEQGISVAMLTGDNRKTAEYIARQVGIKRVIAEVLPSDKAMEIKKLQQEGFSVAMVGDGINDAPALATATVGVAMGTGTDVAIESASITLLGGHISKLTKTVTLARSTMRIIKQNLFWAFFYNILGIPIAAGVLYPFFGILLSPAIAGAAMGFSSVSVVANSLRLKKITI